VSGELSTFEATNGKTYLKLRCNSVDLVGKKDDTPKAAPAQTPPAPDKPAHPNGSGGYPAPIDDFDEDIPF
jgi:hypothetical protein